MEAKVRYGGWGERRFADFAACFEWNVGHKQWEDPFTTIHQSHSGDCIFSAALRSEPEISLEFSQSSQDLALLKTFFSTFPIIVINVYGGGAVPRLLAQHSVQFEVGAWSFMATDNQ